jgi:UDP-2,4-diacetamido-2,4,6-trideoxy-beta-L-altropyranose hydrolase
MSLSVVFVTHAGPAIGLGHERRCLALASAWAAERAEIRFVIAPDDASAARLGRASGSLVRLGAAGVAVTALAWDREPERARETLTRLAPDVLVVDSYAASTDFLASLRETCGRLVAIDDVADRKLPVHVVVNGGVAAESLPYERASATRFLLGARYALIDPRFASARPARSRGRVDRVLVSLGGGRPGPALRAALAAVETSVTDAEVDVVVGPFAGTDMPGGMRRNRLVLHRDPPDMRRLMQGADLAIAGAGVTLYELAATGTPTVVVQMAHNQAANATAFGNAGAAALAGDAVSPRLPEMLADAVGRLVESPALRSGLAGRARDLIDGAGAIRAASEIRSGVGSSVGR